MRQILLQVVSTCLIKQVLENLRSVASLFGSTHNCDDEFADSHAGSSPKKQLPSTQLLNHEKGSRGSNHINNIHDCRNQERVLDTYLLEESGTVINLKVISNKSNSER